MPISPGRCRLFARFLTKFPNGGPPAFLFGLVPKWMSHISNNVILEDDNIFLHKQERNLARKLAGEGTNGKNYGKACHLPTQSDSMLIQYHKWLGKFGNGGPWGIEGKDFEYPPELPREQLLERYVSHTMHCKTC